MNNKYHVTYNYLATGMEGKADFRDFGYVYAKSPEEAIETIGRQTSRDLDPKVRNWGLSAQLVAPGYMTMANINELAFMAKEVSKPVTPTKISNLNTITGAIKAGNFIVGSFSQSTGLSFSDNPVVHYSMDAARAECTRLARINPGKLYLFVKLAGGELIPEAQAVSI